MYMVGPTSLIVISMYKRFGASDISPIQSVGVSIQLMPKLTILSDTEIGCAFMIVDIAKTLTCTFVLGPTIFMILSGGLIDCFHVNM